MYPQLSITEFLTHIILIVTIGVLVLEFVRTRILNPVLTSYSKIIAILGLSTLSTLVLVLSQFFGIAERFSYLLMSASYFGIYLPIFYVFFSLSGTTLQKHTFWLVSFIVFGTVNTLAQFNFEYITFTSNAAWILAGCGTAVLGIHFTFIVSIIRHLHCCIPDRKQFTILNPWRVGLISFGLTVFMLASSIALIQILLTPPNADSLERVTLSYPYDSIFPLQFADIFMAQEAGLFLRKGLEIETLRGSPNGSIANTTVQGYATIGIAGLTDVFDMYATGAEIFVPLIINMLPLTDTYAKLMTDLEKQIEEKAGGVTERYARDKYYVFVVRRDVGRAFPDLLSRFIEGTKQGRIYITKNKPETNHIALERLGVAVPVPSILQQTENILLHTVTYLNPDDIDEAAAKTAYWAARVAEYKASHPEAKDIDFTPLYKP